MENTKGTRGGKHELGFLMLLKGVGDLLENKNIPVRLLLRFDIFWDVFQSFW